jgi:CheY-like chemotaxis protein
MHGGTVRARSEGPGRGSEFIVRLPIAAASLRRHAPEPRGSRGAAPKDLPSVSLRVLVVDDNQDAAESLGMMLSLVGSEVRIAHDGHEAIEAAGDFRPDAVLLDIGLPGLDGYHVAEAIRGRPWGKSMVLVAVTGWGQEKDKNASHAAGFDHHLVKPVDPDALLRLLATVEPGRDNARPGPA